MATHDTILKNDLFLQNQLYLSCYLSWTTQLGNKVKLRLHPFIPWSLMQIVFFSIIRIFMTINETNINKRVHLENYLYLSY